MEVGTRPITPRLMAAGQLGLERAPVLRAVAMVRAVENPRQQKIVALPPHTGAGVDVVVALPLEAVPQLEAGPPPEVVPQQPGAVPPKVSAESLSQE